MAPVRVLAVGAGAEVSSLVERHLADVIVCETVPNAGQARLLLERSHFDVLACEVSDPADPSGELVTEIACTLRSPALAVIATADSRALAEWAIEIDVHAYAVTPLSPGVLRVTLAMALRCWEGELAVRETAERFAMTVQLRDPARRLQVERVAATVALLAEKLGLSPYRVRQLRAAASLHDIGKLATPFGVLYKRGFLTPTERAWMQAHTTVGHSLLASGKSELMQLAATIALTHHEWYDGSGYPQGLRAEEIPVEGRIAAVADVLNALLSDRPYRPAYSVEEATEMMLAERGTHFDPEVLDVLMENLDEALALRR